MAGTTRNRSVRSAIVILLSVTAVTGLTACASSAPAASPSPVATTASASPTPTPTPAATAVATPFSGLAVGDCLNGLTGSQEPEVGTVPVVSCTLSHSAEVYALPTLSGSAYPGDESVSNSASDECGTAFTGYIGVGYETSDLDYSFYTPDQNAWNSGTRQVTCVVFYPQGNIVGSVKGIGTTPPQLAAG